MTDLAMFPLGSVLFPTMVLPLHVFEPRYRQLVADCLAGDQEFGTCLIEKGSEVGGGEVRSHFGTVAQIVDAQAFDDGRWAVVTVGTRRIQIEEWLADSPYPRARVHDWGDVPPATDLTDARQVALDLLQSVLALRSELARSDAPGTTHVDPDPALASYQLAALAPLGEFDRQLLLGAPSIAGRLDQLATLLRESETDLLGQLELG